MSFQNFINVIQSIDPRFTIGWALVWFGLGSMTFAIRQGIKEAQAKKQIREDLFGEGGVGHVVDYHPAWNPAEPDRISQHAHCLCGEKSLFYRKDDPTAQSLMEQWADEHIDTLMESMNR